MPQVTEEILDSVQLVDVGSPVLLITEEILDSVQLVNVGSFVPLIMEDGVDVVQVMPQERQNRTQQQIVDVPVLDKIAIWEKIVEETQLVLSKRKQERESPGAHVVQGLRGVRVPSRRDHTGDALILRTSRSLSKTCGTIFFSASSAYLRRTGLLLWSRLWTCLCRKTSRLLGVCRRMKGCVGGIKRVVWQHSPG